MALLFVTPDWFSYLLACKAFVLSIDLFKLRIGAPCAIRIKNGSETPTHFIP
jgi:hypothetical protein